MRCSAIAVQRPGHEATLSRYHTGRLQHQIGQPVGVLVLMCFIVVSYFILRPVSDAPRQWSDEDRGEV